MVKYKTKRHLDLDATFKEVGEALGCTEHAADQIERRALQKVERILRERYGENVSIQTFLGGGLY